MVAAIVYSLVRSQVTKCPGGGDTMALRLHNMLFEKVLTPLSRSERAQEFGRWVEAQAARLFFLR